ncbi:MAG: hypothetical protein KKD31_07685 [Bacteroidetes bacterium]|nr:hypothetical protein [Bacteroidota bacterium]
MEISTKPAPPKITYLLGAGASANALPMVKASGSNKSFHESLRMFAASLESERSTDADLSEIRNEIAKDVRWLADGTEKFKTPDTYAKFLSLKEKSNLERLKDALSFFFVYEQLVNKKIDDRALVFLTTIMESADSIPENIKILTWNYDFQIQLAAEAFRKEQFSFNPCSSSMEHTEPVIEYLPNHGFQNTQTDRVSLVHLNGIAGFFNMRNHGVNNSIYSVCYEKTHNEVLKLVNSFNHREPNLLSFAWESANSDTVKIAKEIIEETEILVIIGYSFPFFNRAIDKQIFETLMASGKLRKIYYQDPNRNGEFLINRFNLAGVDIKHENDTVNYYIPMEL